MVADGKEGKEGSSLPALLSLRRSSNEAGERPKPQAAVAKMPELGPPIPSIPSTRRPFEELLTAMRKVFPARLPQISPFPICIADILFPDLHSQREVSAGNLASNYQETK